MRLPEGKKKRIRSSRPENIKKKENFFMSNDMGRRQEPAWPRPVHQHILQLFE
jgi:hypothetical protein